MMTVASKEYERRGMRQSFAPSLCSFILVALVACSPSVNPGDLTRVRIWHVADGGHVNGNWSIDLTSDNRYVYVDGVDRSRGRLAPESGFRALGVQPIVVTKSSCNCSSGTFLAFDTRRGSYSATVSDGNHQPLMNLADTVHQAVLYDQYRRNKRTLRALHTLDGLLEVTFNSRGCFGSCGIYTLRATPKETTIDWEGPPDFKHRSGRWKRVTHLPIRWDDVLLVLRTARVDTLRHAYPSSAVDTWQASMTLRFKGFSYSVDAPDSMTWPPAFAAVHAGLQTLLERAHFQGASRA